jgi:uncharacterized membrane protein
MGEEESTSEGREEGDRKSAAPPSVSRKTRKFRGVLPVTIGFLLVLSGLVSALSGGAQVYQITQINPQGEFAGLARGGNDIYLAEEVNNSFGLLKSTDHGLSWFLLPLLTPKVVSGVSWGYAALAADDSDVLFVSATTNSCSIGLNTTILIEASQDGGSTWTHSVLELSIQIGSLGAAVSNGLAAIVWSAHAIDPYSCLESSQDLAQVIVSPDTGTTWSSVQDMTPINGSVLASADIALASSDAGIIAAVEQHESSSSLYQLVIYRYANSSSSGFVELSQSQQLAPVNWALLGTSSTPAFILTPTSLIPIGATEGGSIPFPQLQEYDVQELVQLPMVSALGPVGSNSVDVAVTMPQQGGIDCWRINLESEVVSHSCQVSFQGSLYPTGTSQAVVGLVDGGTWWAALFGTSYSPGYGGGIAATTTATGAYSSSAQTGKAYSFNGTSILSTILTILGAVLIASGLIVLFFIQRSARMRRKGSSEREDTSGLSDSERRLQITTQKAKRDYRIALYCWLGVWSPLVLLAFFPTVSDMSALLWPALVGGAAVGAVLVFPFDVRMRRNLPSWQRPGLLDSFFSKGGVWTSFVGFEGAQSEDRVNRMRATSALLRISWALGFLAGVMMLVSIPIWATSSGTQVTTPSVLVCILAFFLVAFVLVRVIYHLRLASATVLIDGENGGTAVPTKSSLRGILGAALLPWNPLVGALLGLMFQPELNVSPFLLAWAFLVVNMIGIAILLGAFGPTPWTRTETA